MRPLYAVLSLGRQPELHVPWTLLNRGIVWRRGHQLGQQLTGTAVLLPDHYGTSEYLTIKEVPVGYENYEGGHV